MTPRVADIQAAVCQQYHVAPIDMTSHRRGKAVARPRQVAMYLARELTPLSLPAIGRHFGDREHSTVIHACRVTEKRIQADREFANAVARLRFRIANQTVAAAARRGEGRCNGSEAWVRFSVARMDGSSCPDKRRRTVHPPRSLGVAHRTGSLARPRPASLRPTQFHLAFHRKCLEMAENVGQTLFRRIEWDKHAQK